MAIKTDAELKEYFETDDQPTQAQFGDFIDSKMHVNDGALIDHGHFILKVVNDQTINAAVRAILDTCKAKITYPSTWTYGSQLYVSRAELNNPSNVYSSNNQPVIRVSSESGGIYGTHFGIFEGAISVPGGFTKMTLRAQSTESNGATGTLILPTSSWELLKTNAYQSPWPGNPQGPQPVEPGGYSSPFLVDETIVRAATGSSSGSGISDVYGLGNGCIAELEGVDAASATYSVSGGVGTITLPSGVRLKRATIQGVAGDASYSAGNYSDAFKLRIVGEIGSQTKADMLLRPVPSVVNMNNAGDPISANADLVFDDGLVKVHVDEVSAGVVGYVANKLGSTFNVWAFVM